MASIDLSKIDLSFALLHLGFIIPFVLADLLFLGVLAKKFYRQQLGGLLLERFNVGAALLFYAAYLFGVSVFVLFPALSTDKSGIIGAIWRGAALGFTAYATYNLTNLATLKGWPRLLTVVDIAWGTVATASCAAFAVWLVG